LILLIGYIGDEIVIKSRDDLRDFLLNLTEKFFSAMEKKKGVEEEIKKEKSVTLKFVLLKMLSSLLALVSYIPSVNLFLI
jgi:hypothetical protein